MSYMLLKETDPGLLRKHIVEYTVRLFRADVARLFEPDGRGELEFVVQSGSRALPESARSLEDDLAVRAVAAEKSLISDHSRLYPELRSVASRALRDGVLTHAMLIRAHARSHGVVCVHWIGRDRPGYEERRGIYTFWDNVGLALAHSNDHVRLERLAFYDELTGLPNQRLLNDELERRIDNDAVAVLHVDFDGMREANNSPFGYDGGGDFLIRTVGEAIPKLLVDGEMAARLHRAGDEFACVLLPHVDAAQRAADLEGALDNLELPDSHRPFYGGASVGHAESRPGDTPASLLARAAASMQLRKKARQQLKTRREGSSRR